MSRYEAITTGTIRYFLSPDNDAIFTRIREFTEAEGGVVRRTPIDERYMQDKKDMVEVVHVSLPRRDGVMPFTDFARELQEAVPQAMIGIGHDVEVLRGTLARAKAEVAKLG